jgi:hypothetical protein
MAWRASGSAIETWFGAMRTNVPAKRGESVVRSEVQTERSRGGRFTVLFVQLVNDLRPVAIGRHPTQPSVGELGEPRSGNGSYLLRVDGIRQHMSCYNEQRARGNGSRPVFVAEVEGWQRHGEEW